MKGENRFNTEINIKGAKEKRRKEKKKEKKRQKYSVQTKLRIGPPI